MITPDAILSRLPYENPFLFVDGIDRVNESEIEGHYTFKPDEFFYRGHFIGNPVTPGVILLETMAQIALVSHVIFLAGDKRTDDVKLIAFTSANVDFLKPVWPGEKVVVHGKLIYFRLGKIKSEVMLYKSGGEVAAKGVLSGMVRV